MGKIDESYFIKDPIKQNKIEDILDEDEKILVELKPNKTAYILEYILRSLPIVLIWAGFDISVLVMIAKSGAFAHTIAVVMISIFFALHLLPIWMFIAGLIKNTAGFKNLQFYLTDKRIIGRSGLIGIDFKSIFYSDIVGVNVKVSITDRILKVGDIYISAKEQSMCINDVKDPYFYMSRLQKISLDIKADIYYPNDLRPDENHGYNTKYKEKE